jgi:hypothetical protein
MTAAPSSVPPRSDDDDGERYRPEDSHDSNGWATDAARGDQRGHDDQYEDEHDDQHKDGEDDDGDGDHRGSRPSAAATPCPTG